jgi:hypothetical protein
MTLKASIDRFEEGKAVLSVGEFEDKYIVPQTSLLRGVKKGSWLLVKVEKDHIVDVVLNEKETTKAKEGIAEKIARLLRWGHRQ